MRKILLSLIFLNLQADPTKIVEVKDTKSKEFLVVISQQPDSQEKSAQMVVPVKRHKGCSVRALGCCACIGCALVGAGGGATCLSGLTLMATSQGALATYLGSHIGSHMALWGSLACCIGASSAKALSSELGDEIYQSC